ncbi:hypothetical protein JXQ70_10695 [bacterium]|nr:hypothetical protein [bacterium]
MSAEIFSRLSDPGSQFQNTFVSLTTIALNEFQSTLQILTVIPAIAPPLYG